MTTNEFNKKYIDYLEEGHYGLAINDKDVINYLDRVFSDILIHLPGFEYAQIKMKFGSARVYVNNVPHEISSVIESRINSIAYEET